MLSAPPRVALTPNEWIKAQRFGNDYWLYIVTDCRGAPQLHLIQDPASKLSPKEEMSVVRYMVEYTDSGCQELGYLRIGERHSDGTSRL
ncbi:MAG: DUF3883 domain-containing protein [Pirellulales bacterium]